MPSSGPGGPCCHCERTHSCCWRRGPPSKPILCNACGSRYLVRRSLEGYRPIATRAGAGSPTGGSKPQRAQAQKPVAISQKPKRAIKRVEPAALSNEAYESEDSQTYFTDDSSSGGGGEVQQLRGGGPQRQPSILVDANRKVLRISSQRQLKELGADAFHTLAGALLGSSLRIKPRKPLNPTITAVF